MAWPWTRRERTPAESRAAEVKSLRRRVRDLEAELHDRDRLAERLEQEAARERLDFERRIATLESTVRVQRKDVENMAGLVERYRAMVESATQIDVARAEAAAAMARRPQNMGGYG